MISFVSLYEYCARTCCIGIDQVKLENHQGPLERRCPGPLLFVHDVTRAWPQRQDPPLTCET